MKFRARSLDKPTDEECSNPSIKHVLTGSTFDDRAISGSDVVTFTGPDCN